MNVTQEKIDDLNAIIKVTVSPEDYQDKVHASLKDYARKANLKGFRPGKVPVSVVKKMVGESIMFDEISKKLQESLDEYIKEEQLEILGQPLPRKVEKIDLNPDAGLDYDFEYEVGLKPDITLTYSISDAPVKYKVTVDDEYLQKEIDATRLRHGDVTNPDESIEGDILFGKLAMAEGQEGSVPDDFVFGNTPSMMLALNPERVASEELKGQMVGKKAEDRISGIQLLDIFKDTKEAKKFWSRSDKERPDLTVSDEEMAVLEGLKYDFEVKRINRYAKAELSAELFEKVYGKDGVKDEAEFRAKMREDLEKYLADDAVKFYRSKAIEAILDINDVPLPDEFLQKWLIEANENVTEDQVAKEYEGYAKSLRWSLVVRQIRKDNPEILVERPDVEAKVRGFVEERFGNAANESNPEQLDGIVNYYMNDQKTYEQFYGELLDEKIFGHLDAQIDPEEKEISASEYIDLD